MIWKCLFFSANIDIDECEQKTANCGPDEICKNKPGGYTCACPSGYALNAQRRCEDVNECEFYKAQVSKFEHTVCCEKISIKFVLFCSRYVQAIPTVWTRPDHLDANAKMDSRSKTEAMEKSALISMNAMKSLDCVNNGASIIGDRIAVLVRLDSG